MATVDSGAKGAETAREGVLARYPLAFFSFCPLS